MSAASLASPRAWVRSALPVSSAMVRAISSTRASIASAILSSSLPRSRGTTFFHAGNALAAAATAASTSAAAPRGTSATVVRLAGFSMAMRAPEALPTHWPPINMPLG